MKTEAEEFISLSGQFRLGELTTEARHPDTTQLSQWSEQDLSRATTALHKIDADALDVVLKKLPEIEELRKNVESTLQRGGRIFLCGCGATGRLSLSLEYLWRLTEQNKGAVVGFMAGGDTALIKSIENFEDRPEYAVRQMQELNFSEKDFLISCTEGGETPFVIGATEYAASISKLSPYFLYCNPDSQLNSVERSKRVLNNAKIKKINLTTGPMALSGSTRMQASTVLMLATGLALFFSKEQREEKLTAFVNLFRSLNFNFLTTFIENETTIYNNCEFVIYETKDYAITVLTDTTERSPTFSLFPFENDLSPGTAPSLSYLCVKESASAEEAWQMLLLRNPRSLEWETCKNIAGRDFLMGFDISESIKEKRASRGLKCHTFNINQVSNGVSFELNGSQHTLQLPQLHPLFEHTLLKTILNAHSTLVMGRLKRYSGNIMTWVKPTNNKLIDRSVRYIQHLLKDAESDSVSYEEIVKEIFRQIPNLKSDEPIVLKCVEALKNK